MTTADSFCAPFTIKEVVVALAVIKGMQSILQLQHCSYDDYLGLADEKNKGAVPKPEGEPQGFQAI